MQLAGKEGKRLKGDEGDMGNFCLRLQLKTQCEVGKTIIPHDDFSHTMLSVSL